MVATVEAPMGSQMELAIYDVGNLSELASLTRYYRLVGRLTHFYH